MARGNARTCHRNQVAVCNDWPELTNPGSGTFRRRRTSSTDGQIPPHLLTGTKNLFRHMILQNAGVLPPRGDRDGGHQRLGRPVARALGSLLRAEQDEAWLRIRAEFALGFLQRHDATVETDLTDACEHAYENLKRGRELG